MIARYLLRRLFRPLSRPAALFLLWSHRNTIALWVRSIRAEFERGRLEGHDPHRNKALLSALWRVSTQTALVQESKVHRVAVAEDDQSLVVTLDADTSESPGFSRSGIYAAVSAV